METDSPSFQPLNGRDFSAAPASWYYLGSVKDLTRGPLRFALPGEHAYTGFRTESGKLAVISGKCSHMGADLSKGCVIGESIACPLHGWEYGTNGHCARIPASPNIPGFARQASFPVEERGGQIFFFNRPEARFPLPFFDDLVPEQLLATSAFEFTVDAPWYLVSSNGFDVQHFQCAHERILEEAPVVDSPHPFARRLSANFRVSGSSFYERMTRWFSGARVRMTVTSWCGNLVLVTAKFRRSTSYGIVCFVPLHDGRTRMLDVVWVPRSRGFIGRCIVDPVDALIRRRFIQEFMRSDVDPTDGIRLNPSHLIAEDQVLVDYLGWLKKIHR